VLRLPFRRPWPLIPRRACSTCGVAHDVVRMALRRRRWVCPACLTAEAARWRGGAAGEHRVHRAEEAAAEKETTDPAAAAAAAPTAAASAGAANARAGARRRPDGTTQGRHRQGAADGRHRPSAAVAEALADLRQIERGIRWGGASLRVLLYAGLIAWAQRSPLGLAVLTGVLAADLASAVIGAWLAMALSRRPSLLDVAIYLAVGWFWWRAGGSLQLPADAESRALMVLAGMTAFALKSVRLVSQALHGR
jgi:hypothetical protein